MGVSGNPANRAAARAQGRGSTSRVLSAFIVIDELGDKPSDAIAVAVVQGIGMLIEQGGAPIERCAITMGSDHPEHPGKLVLEVKTDRRAPREVSVVDGLGKPMTLDDMRAAAAALAPTCGHPVGVDNGNDTAPCKLPQGHDGELHDTLDGAVGY